MACFLEHPVSLFGLGPQLGTRGRDEALSDVSSNTDSDTEGPWASELHGVGAGRRRCGAHGATTGARSPAHTPTHRRAALLQLHDLGPQLGSLPLLLFRVLHPERQHLRQPGHLLAGLRWGGVRRGQLWLPGSSVSQMPPSTCTPQLAPSTRGSTGLSIPHSGLLFNKHLLTDTEQGVGQAVSKTWPQPTLSSRLVWRLREKEIAIVHVMD